MSDHTHIALSDTRGDEQRGILSLINDFESAVRVHQDKGDADAEARRRWVETLDRLFRRAGAMADDYRVADGLITEAWLAEVGFKWSQLERQPTKHWLLWIGDACDASGEDLGIELAEHTSDGSWFCWFRGDSAGRYHRFIHLRHIRTRLDVVRMFEGLTGQTWDPRNHFSGHALTPARAAYQRELNQRLDRRMRDKNAPWLQIERDDTRAGALPEHLEHFAKSRGEFDKKEGRP